MEMKSTIFKKVRFLESASDSSKLPDFGLPEIAVVGRSNVGKSSFINCLAGTSIAKTSKTPGRTRLVNYFDFDSRFILVDLPGYGYAEASKTQQATWQDLMAGFLLESQNLKHILLLVDIRHKPSELDLAMQHFLFFHNLSFSVIATKSDKIAKSKILHYKKEIAATLKVGVDNVLTVSNLNKQGRENIVERIQQFL